MKLQFVGLGLFAALLSSVIASTPMGPGMRTDINSLNTKNSRRDISLPRKKLASAILRRRGYGFANGYPTGQKQRGGEPDEEEPDEEEPEENEDEPDEEEPEENENEPDENEPDEKEPEENENEPDEEEPEENENEPDEKEHGGQKPVRYLPSQH